MSKIQSIWLSVLIVLVILGGAGVWYTSNHTTPLSSQALLEKEEKVFHVLHEQCLNEIVGLSAEAPLSEACGDEMKALEPLDEILSPVCIAEYSDIADGIKEGLSDVCRVELYNFYNSPENTGTLLSANIESTQSKITIMTEEIQGIETELDLLKTQQTELNQTLSTANTDYTQKYTNYTNTKRLYDASVNEYTRLKKISDKNKNITPSNNIQKQINDLRIALAKNKRRTNAEKTAYNKIQTQITELSNLLATNNAKANMERLRQNMDTEKTTSDEASIILNKAKSDIETVEQLLSNKTTTLESKKGEKQILENTLAYLKSQKPTTSDEELFGKWDENIDFGPDFDGIVIDVVPDILEKHSFIYDNAGDKILFETRIQEMKDLISKQEFGAIKLILGPEEKVEDKTQYSIAYSENQKTYRVVEMFIIPYNDVNSEIRDGAYKKKFNKNIALNNLRKGGTCALQSILKLRLGACGDASTLVSGDKWNEDAANKIVKDAWGGSDVDPKSTDKSKKDYSFSREETKLALEKNGFKNCRRISSDEFCKNIKTEKSNFCILHVNSSTGGHAMPIYGAKNSIFGSCKIVVEDTGNQGDETGMPVNPGYQMWGPGGLEQPTSNVWDGYKPAEVTCCESACNG